MQELKKVCSNLRREGIDFALLSSHEAIAHVSGFDVPLPIGAATDFSGGYPLALVLINAKEEYGILITANTFITLAESEAGSLGKMYFQIFDHFSDIDSVKSYVDCVQKALKHAGMQSGLKLGIEYNTLPSVLLNQFLSQEIDIVDAASAMEKARRVKTDREIELLSNAARVADAGQMALLKASKSTGQSEFEIWADVFEEMSKAAGIPVVVSGEIVTGERTGVVRYPGGPIPRTIRAGDSGIMDISIRINGYWCDCCNFVVFDRQPNDNQRNYYNVSKGAFEAALETIRPGVRACDVFFAMQRVYKKNNLKMPHYGGHQIGTAVNEKPRIVPYDTTVIEPGMVFCFEPGAYAGEAGATGARLEKMVLVADSGIKIFNKFPFGLEV